MTAHNLTATTAPPNLDSALAFLVDKEGLPQVLHALARYCQGHGYPVLQYRLTALREIWQDTLEGHRSRT